MKHLTISFFGMLCLLACSYTQPEPKGTLRLQLVTTAPQIDLYMYTMPDTIMRLSGTYQVQYLDMGILTLNNVKKGQYILRLRGTSTLPNMLDTLINFDGKDRVYLLKF
jgi:hypothetical protein